MRSLNIDQLKTFATIIDLGSFSAAARKLHLSQPAVSLQLRALEDRFSLKLLDRNAGRLVPTQPGRMLLERSRALIAEHDGVLSSLSKFENGGLGRVNISTTVTTLAYHLPPILKRLRIDHPQIEINVVNMVTKDSIEAVSDEAIDFGLVTLPVKTSHVKMTRLREEKLVAIFSKDEKKVPTRVTPSFVETQSLILEHERGAIVDLVGRWLASQKVPLRASMHVGTVDAVTRLVSSGLGMSIIPDVAVVRPSVISRPLYPPIRSAIGLVEKRVAAESPARRIVREALLSLEDTVVCAG